MDKPDKAISSNRIEEQEAQIRDLINHPWKVQSLLQDKTKWNMLCASMDVIGDSQAAINSFRELPDFSAMNGGYLYIYGLLQALFLQQDAINHLSKALFDEEINWKKDIPDLYEIREIRNNSIGHPTNRGKGKSFHFVGRGSISNEGFEIMSVSSADENTIFEEVHLDLLLRTQELLVVDTLDKVIDRLSEDFLTHKLKFKGDKLTDLLPGMLNYHMSKLTMGIHGGYELVAMSLDGLFNPYQQIKEGIVKRYGDLSALQEIEDLIRRMDHVFYRFNSWIVEGKLKDNMDAEIQKDSLKGYFDELREMLVEIDKEFEI